MKAATSLSALAVTAFIMMGHAEAADTKPHEHHNHDAMKTAKGTNEADATGVVNAVNADGKSVNITHDPVEALGWPKMTMDLPVTRRVDLSAVKAGEPVLFKLKKGRDNKFRIIGIEKQK